jgi:hypothetical protein
MPNTKKQTVLRAIGALEQQFRHHADVAVSKIIALAFANPNRKLTEPAGDALELLILLGGAKLDKRGLTELTFKLEELHEALEAAKSTAKKRESRSK